MKRSTLVAALALTVFVGAACSDDDDPIVPLIENLQLTLTGFEPLMNGFHYEG